MPRVTDIKQQQRNSGRYSIYLDGKYTFSLSELDVAASGLRIGSEVTESELRDLRSRGEASKAYDRALSYLSFRQRTEAEMRRYLQGKEYDDEVIHPVIARLRELKLLDDAEFARSWVRTRQMLRPRSKRVLQAELAQKGVPAAIISIVLDEVDAEDQIDALRSLISRRGARYDSPEKLMAYLARQGFSYDLVKQAMERERDDNT